MATHNYNVVRFQNDLEGVFRENIKDILPKSKFIWKSKSISGFGCHKEKSQAQGNFKKPLKPKVLSRVFSEDYERLNKKILDPRGLFVQRWNKIFLVACLVSLFVDPIFFYLPVVSSEACIRIERPLEKIVTILRSMTDVFYLFHIFIQFRTAFVAPSSRVFGRGELVIDPTKIAHRYLKKNFWVNVIAALPLPQIVIWLVLPRQNGSTATSAKNVLRFITIFQYLPRLFMIYPLTSQIVKETGVVTETAWAGAAYNLLLYMLASHVLGASWYLLAIERQDACWRKVCQDQMPVCHLNYFDCTSLEKELSHHRHEWFRVSNVTNLCGGSDNYFNFGIYINAVQNSVTSSEFLDKYFYCLWWGLQTLSSLGQNLDTSTYVGEISFAILIAIIGLVLFALLIGNMQTYLQSITIKLEQWRIKQMDTEEWMQHRQLPPELSERIRRYNQYKWVATRGVDEKSLLENLPMDLCRDIKRHLCLDLVRRVPLFNQMDDRMLDAICERLKPALSTQGTFLVREGDPVNEMLFIIRGHLDSCTTNGGQVGFFNSSIIGSGDFCGEELLTWALDPKSNINLPSSTRTVQALVEVEAFALQAEDLKFVASQFRRLHSKKLQHTFRFYSHQWRTWAACFIQAAWRRFKRRKIAEVQYKEEYNVQHIPALNGPASTALGATIYASRFAANTRKGVQTLRNTGYHNITYTIPTLRKPAEPDFSTEDEEKRQDFSVISSGKSKFNSLGNLENNNALKA